MSILLKKLRLTLKFYLRDEIGVCSNRVELVPFSQIPYIDNIVITTSNDVETV